MPVVIATGEKYKVETDFTAVNEYSFSLQRTYRSMFGSGTLFGANWMSNLDVPALQWNKAQCQKFPNGDCVPVSVSFVDVTGAQTTYKLGPYEGGHEFVYLASDGTAIYHDYRQDWQLHRENQTYIYSDSGLIRSVSLPLLENTLVFEHGDENRLKSVTSLSGHKVQFVWDGDRVAQVIDPNGGVWTYTKHPFGSSVDAYLSSQLSERFVEAVVLPTTGAQEKTIAEAMIAYSKQGYALMSHNCATAVDSALTKAGAISNSSQSFLPGSNFQNLLGAPGAKYIYIPKGSLVPATFGAFNPGGR